ncbi:MAG: metallophosphoesterase [bacterium]|nr:metallophosphoesterase [bacterium]
MEKGLGDVSEEAFLGGRWRPTRAWAEDPAVADGAVRRVLVLGDIHNSDGALGAALRAAERERCDAVVSVGDFWLQDCSWGTRPQTDTAGRPSHSWTPLMRLAMAAPLPVIVIDGNHEAWPCLVDYAQRPDVARARPAGRPLHLGGTLWWADRGSTWTWSGRRCGALGGAVSPDKFITRLAPHRWPDHEVPTRDDLRRLLANAPEGLDVLFCHDAPAAAAGLKGLPKALIPDWILAECREVRGLLQDAVERTRPQVVCHGHWHQTNYAHIGDVPTEVFGLNRDGKAGSAAVLDFSHCSAAATALS